MSIELFEEEYSFRDDPRDMAGIRGYSLLPKSDPDPEHYCMRHGGYMQQWLPMIKSNGAAYALSDDFEFHFCPCCIEEIYEHKSDELSDDVTLGEFAETAVKEWSKQRFESWDSGDSEDGLFVYIDEVEVMEDGNGHEFWAFGEFEVDDDDSRSLAEPSPGTKKLKVLLKLNEVKTPITSNELSAQTSLGGCSSHLSILWRDKMVDRRDIGEDGLEYGYWLSKYGKMVCEEYQ